MRKTLVPHLSRNISAHHVLTGKVVSPVSAGILWPFSPFRDLLKRLLVAKWPGRDQSRQSNQSRIILGKATESAQPRPLYTFVLAKGSQDKISVTSYELEFEFLSKKGMPSPGGH